ncbi:MAG: DsrE/DsrF/DrsH-like family protein [bacterium]
MAGTAADKKKITLIVLSGDLDKVLAAFIIAVGAASAGIDATMFFTFWGLNVLRKSGGRAKGNWMQRMMALLNRGGADRLPLSKFHMAGIGTRMMGRLMRQFKMPNVREMIALSKELGVKLIACTTTMGIMGIAKENLIPEVDAFAGVATYIAEAGESKINLFIS